MTRAAIAQVTGISKPTISGAAQRLVAQALVIETKRKSKNTQGRAGVIYELNAEAGCVLGVALNSEFIEVRVLDLSKKVTFESSHAYDANCTVEYFEQTLHRIVSEVLASITTPLLAVGVSIADPVNVTTGQVIALPRSPFPIAHHIDFPRLFFGLVDCPVTIDNDVNWATLAERAETKLNHPDNFIYVYLGKGIGAGVVVDDRLVRGGHGLAGEIGYIKVNEHANLQDFVLEHRLKQTLMNGAPLDAHPAVNRIADIIAAAATFINPSTIILGGPLCSYPALVDTLRQRIADDLFTPTEIVASALPESAPLSGACLGAYELALTQLGMLDPLADIAQTGFVSQKDNSRG